MIIKKTMVAAAVGALFMPAVWAQANASSHTGIKNLPAVTVTADAEPAYVVKNSSAGSRTDTPIEQIPQSIIVVPRGMMEDQDSRTVSDALRNVSNVTDLDPRDSNITPFKIRGFNSALVVDGVSMPGYFSNAESLVNIERIDVIKGPAGSLFGSGQAGGGYGNLGGTVAITTSDPQQQSSRQVAVRLGTFGERGLTLDLNQAINSDLAARIAVDAGRSDSESKGVYFKRTAVFPSISWSPHADTKVVLRMRYLDNATLDYSALPPDGTINTSKFTLPRDLNVTAVGLPETTQKATGVNLQWTQKINPTWNFSLVAAQNNVDLDERGVAPQPYGGPGAVQALYGLRLWQKMKTSALSPSLTGKFDTGSIKHTVTMGLDYEKTTDNASMLFAVGTGSFGELGLVDLTSPVFPAWVEPVNPAEPQMQNRYQSTVAYVQDQVDIGNLHLLGSLRISKIDVTDYFPSWRIDSKSSNKKITPRLGAVYDFNQQVSAFAGYSEGIKVPISSVFSQPPKPEESRQQEIGLRLKNLGGVTATIALFDLVRKNAAVADAANPGYSIQVGKQRAKGLDVDVRWKASESLTLIAALTTQTAKITEDTNAKLVNKQLFRVPEKQMRLAARYDVRSGDFAGLGLGLGMTYHSKLPGDNTNSFFTQAATVLDAQVSYVRGNARYGLSIQNLLNKQYYKPSTYFAGGQVTPAQPRTFAISANFAF